MKRLRTKITYRVPRGDYCNHNITNSKSTPYTRCRFCTDLGKDGFTCVLHNEPLAVVSGKYIYKTDSCMYDNKVVDDVVEAAPQAQVPPREIMKYAIQEYMQVVAAIMEQGVPEKLARKAALEEVLRSDTIR